MNKKDVIFDFIVAYKTDNDGNSPSIRDIRDRCKIPSTSTVYYYLMILDDEEKIIYHMGQTRSIEVIGGKWRYEHDLPELEK